MKKLLAIAALTVMTTASASAATYYQGWRAHGLQSYASADELMITHRDSSTTPYIFMPQVSGSSVVQ
jgi:hypothetical protein